MKIRASTRVAYLAPTRGRSFLTKSAAIKAEARALLYRKYPTERGDISDGDHYWDWTEDERLQRVYRRLVRMLERSAP